MLQNKLFSGITAYRNGNRLLAMQYFREVIDSDAGNENAWLWLAACSDNIQEKEFCFSKVLQINPNNKAAQEAMSEISKIQPPSLKDLIGISNKVQKVQGSPQLDGNKIFVQALTCPMCGAGIKSSQRECGYCGSTLIITSIETIFSRNFDTNLLSTSINRWKSVLTSDPENAEANYALGLLYLNLKLMDVALFYLRKATILMPEYAVVHYNYALALNNDGKVFVNSATYQELNKYLDYAIGLQPDFKEAIAFKHFLMGVKLIDVDVLESIKEYQLAISICSDIALFYTNLGYAYYRSNDYNQSECNYLTAIRLDPKMALTYSNLSLLYFRMKDYDKGIMYGSKGVELVNSNLLEKHQSQIYNNYSLCLMGAGRAREAIEMVKKALALCPNDINVQQNLRAYLEESSRKKSSPIVRAF